MWGNKVHRHILNPPRNKNLKRLTSNLFLKLVLLAHKTLGTHLATREKNLFSNSEHYDLTNDKEFESKIWDTYTCTSKVLDPTVISPKIHQNLKTYTLYWKNLILRSLTLWRPFNFRGRVKQLLICLDFQRGSMWHSLLSFFSITWVFFACLLMGII